MKNKFNPNSDEHLEHVLKKCYRFALGDDAIGTVEILSDLTDAICNLIGDEKYCEFLDKEIN